MAALEIELRYDIDHTGFFNDPEARDALRAAADLYEDLITDKLGAINPAAFPPKPGEAPRSWTPTYFDPADNSVHRVPNGHNMVVPEDTIIIYAATRRIVPDGLGGVGGFTQLSAEFPPYAWANQVAGRGEPGAVRYNGLVWSNPTDFAPWGGTVFFNEGVNWNFSTSEADRPGTVSLVSVALHEIAHVLGFGDLSSGFSTWGRVTNGSYVGPLGEEAYQGQTLFLDRTGTHWSALIGQSRTIEAFGRRHGERQHPLMVPSITNFETFFWVPTNLDIATLQDLGWEVAPFNSPSPAKVGFADGEPVVGIPTLTGFRYHVMRSSALADEFEEVSKEIPGDGRLQGWIDPQGNTSQAYYRLRVEPESGAAAQASAEPMSIIRLSQPVAAPDRMPTLSRCGVPARGEGDDR